MANIALSSNIAVVEIINSVSKVFKLISKRRPVIEAMDADTINMYSERMELYTQLITSTAKNIENVVKIKTSFFKSVIKLKKLSNIIPLYMDCIDSVIQSFSTEKFNNKTLNEMLGYYEKDDKGRTIDPQSNTEVSKTGYAVIDATSQLSTLMKNILGGIKAISDFDGWFLKPYLKIKAGKGVISGYISMMISAVLDAFKNVDTSQFNDIMPILLGDPERIESNMDILKESDKDGKENLVDLSKTITTKGRMGLIEGMTQIMSIISSINGLSVSPAKFVKFLMGLKLVKTQIGKIITMITTLVKAEEVALVQTQVSNVSQIVGNIAEQTGIVGIFFNLKQLIKSMKSMMWSLLSLKVFGGFGLISSLFTTIRKILVIVKKLDKVSFTEAESKGVVNKIKGIRSIINQTAILCGTLLLIAPILLATIVISPILLLGFWLLPKIINIIAKSANSMMKFNVVKGLLAFIAILGVLVLLTGALWLVSMVAKPIVKSLGWTALLLLGILGITVLMTALGLGAALISPILVAALIGIAAIGLMVLGVLALARMLMLLQDIRLDEKAIRDNVGVIIGTAMSVIDGLFNSIIGSSKEADKPWYEEVLRFIGVGVGSVITAILSIAFLAASIVSVFMILLLAGQLRLLQTINLNKSLIDENVDIVVGTALSIVDKLFGPKDPETHNSEKGFFETLLNHIGNGPVVSIINAIMSIAFLAASIVSIMLVLFIAGQLRLLQTIDLDAGKIASNVSTVIGAAKNVINKVTAKDDTKTQKSGSIWKKLLDWVMPDAVEELIDAISAIGFLSVAVTCVGMVSKLADHILNIQKIPNPNTVAPKVDNVIAIAKTIISKMAGVSTVKMDTWQMEGKLRIIERLNKAMVGFGQISDAGLANGERALNSYSSFLTKINDTDLEKLKTAKNLVQRMAEFSSTINGNFEGLADTLNDKIAPLMEEIKDALDQVKNGNISISTSSTESSPMSATGNSGQVQSDSQEQLRELRRSFTQQSKENMQLISKIDELIDLFKFGQAKVAVN